MLGKRPSPVIGKLNNSFISGNNKAGGLVEVSTTTSPRSPLDFKIQSPRSLKNYDLGGVGLGIVAALEKKSPNIAGDEIPASKAVYNRKNLNRSNPIPVKSHQSSCINSRRNDGNFEMDNSSEEDYTVVTCRRPGNKSYTRVYYDGGNDQRKEFDRRNSKVNHRRPSVFAISPARIGSESSIALPASDFLSSCHMCQKKLHGKDIFMYRGEKAFCSTECRYSQIVMDEHKEKCSSEVKKSGVEISSSPCNNKNAQIFSPGIFAI